MMKNFWEVLNNYLNNEHFVLADGSVVETADELYEAVQHGAKITIVKK